MRDDVERYEAASGREDVVADRLDVFRAVRHGQLENLQALDGTEGAATPPWSSA